MRKERGEGEGEGEKTKNLFYLICRFGPSSSLSLSRQVDGMHDDDDDDGGGKENRTRPVYRGLYMFKKQLEIIPFLFSSQTDREATKV
jgi:hypothetical protein